MGATGSRGWIRPLLVLAIVCSAVTPFLVRSGSAGAAGEALVPLDPARLLETRTGPTDTTIDGLFQGDGPTPAATTIELTVAGRGNVPPDATAAFLNVTAVFPDGPGYLTIYPCGTTRPLASNLNYTAGQVIANAALAKIGADGKVCIYTHATTDIVTDVNGYVPTDAPPPTTTTTTTTTTLPPEPCGGATTVLSSDECAALDALYTSTNGAGWTDNTGWDTDTDPCTWHGVICDTIELRAILLDANNLVGTIPVEIGDLTGIVALNLGFNELSGPIPTEIGNLTKMTTLSLHGNELTGTIPTQIGNLIDVAYLSLFDNQLTGTIPSGLGGMSKLYVLYLYDNQLDGPIPTQLGDATKLQTLWLSGNQLTGPIPTQIGNLTELITLRLYGNSLDGAIPTQIGNLTELVRLELHQNQLTGAIPDEIGLLTKMQILRLHDNQLAGDLTTPMSALRTAGTVSTLFLLGNDCLSTTDPTLATWLSGFDPTWSDGCP